MFTEGRKRKYQVFQNSGVLPRTGPTYSLTKDIFLERVLCNLSQIKRLPLITIIHDIVMQPKIHIIKIPEQGGQSRFILWEINSRGKTKFNQTKSVVVKVRNKMSMNDYFSNVWCMYECTSPIMHMLIKRIHNQCRQTKPPQLLTTLS